jgi:hypothetical protein
MDAATREALARRWAPTLHRTVQVLSEPIPRPEPLDETPQQANAADVASSDTNAAPEAAKSASTVPNSFVADVGGKTLLNAPASVFAKPEWSEALSPNPGMLWMQGRFVGAEEANRNGALWSTGDLEFGEATVVHGPLNWLHEARHIIGTIADARLVKPEAGPEQAAESVQPHIVAASAVWKWIYPDEAWVIEQADDTGMLWYSMECIASEVECAGENGCGNITSYADYLMEKACMHVRERSSTRRLINPTFLGGAVIVPPARPGWADADARMLPEAAALSEKAYEQAGRPDIKADVWDQLVNQVVTYGKGQA